MSEWRLGPCGVWEYVSGRGQILITIRAGELWRASGFGYVVGGLAPAQALHLLALLLREEDLPGAADIVRCAAAIFPDAEDAVANWSRDNGSPRWQQIDGTRAWEASNQTWGALHVYRRAPGLWYARVGALKTSAETAIGALRRLTELDPSEERAAWVEQAIAALPEEHR